MELFSRATQVDPLCEEAHTELMRLYASTGQRGRALRQFRFLQDALAAELDVEPDEAGQKMRDAIVAGRFADDDPQGEQAVPVATHNLPLPLTSFVGRQAELETVRRLLRSTRLLTLIGVGGTGKTRLALQAG